jgi:hypothetical protein
MDNVKNCDNYINTPPPNYGTKSYPLDCNVRQVSVHVSEIHFLRLVFVT